MSKRRPLAQLIADPETDPRLLEQIRQLVEIREFASRRLGLPDNKLGSDLLGWSHRIRVSSVRGGRR